jgi:hypothetical protein
VFFHQNWIFPVLQDIGHLAESHFSLFVNFFNYVVFSFYFLFAPNILSLYRPLISRFVSVCNYNVHNWPRDQFLTPWVCPQVIKLAPRGKLDPQGWTFSPKGIVHPLFTHRGEHSLMFYIYEQKGKQGLHTLGDNFTPRCQLHPWWPTSPRGSNIAPMGEVKTWPQQAEDTTYELLFKCAFWPYVAFE